MNDRPYRYFSTHGYWMPATRDEWLTAILSGLNRPKPPEWWLAAQETEHHRNRKTASIIWTRSYKTDRKYVIWDQAPDEDFLALEYMS